MGARLDMATIRSLFWHKYLSIKVFGTDFQGTKVDVTSKLDNLGFLMFEVDYDPAMLNLQAPPIGQIPTQPMNSAQQVASNAAQSWHIAWPTMPPTMQPLAMNYGEGANPNPPGNSSSSDFTRGARAMQDAIMNEKQNALAKGNLNLEDFRISAIDIPKDKS